jgi:septal ring-binding cell division protein DamX
VKPAPQNDLTEKQFFLTRQTANLMEDFVREIEDTSSLFLLYGDESVGKSWLLRELTSRRFKPGEFHWLDFKNSNASSVVKAKATQSSSARGAPDIGKLMEKAGEGELIIVDHFELASNKAQHALFQSWATDGKDKKLNLIIAAKSESFNEVRQLAQQNHIEIKSFQLLPSSREEVEAFISFLLFPDNPLRPLSFTSEISRQIKNCNGVIGNVTRVAAQQQDLITQKIESKPERKNGLVVGLVLGLLIIMALAYWFLKPAVQQNLVDNSPLDTSGVTLPEIEPVTVNSTKVDELTGSNATDELIVSGPTIPEPVQQDDSIEQTEPLQIDNPISDQQSGTDTVDRVQLSQMPPETDDNPVQDLPASIEAEVEQTDQLVSDAPVKGYDALLLESANRHSASFQQDLKNTLNWLMQIDKDRATIQIMSLGLSEFTDDNYYKSLDKMKKQGVDVSLIKIYPTRIKDRVLYGVIYGDYDNREEAREQIQQLPEGVKSNSPVTRTMNGIWKDIIGK